jgi:hypothetical protein
MSVATVQGSTLRSEPCSARSGIGLLPQHISGGSTRCVAPARALEALNPPSR